MNMDVALEGLVWKQALEHFGTAELCALLLQADDRYQQLRTGHHDIFRVMPVEVFGAEVLALIESLPQLYQISLLKQFLMMPGAQRQALFNAMLQSLPLDDLSEPLRELRLSQDLGL